MQLYKTVDDFNANFKYILRMSQGDVGCVSMLECTVNCEGGEVACSRRCLFRGPSGCVGFWHC